MHSPVPIFTDAASPPGRQPAPPLALRLAIGREGIGLELAEPVQLECLRVTELAVSLPGMRFPVDVSGGVPRFRHRRGEIQRVEIELHARELESWLSARLRGVVDVGRPEVWVEMRRAGATISVAARATPAAAGIQGDSPILVFDLSVVTEDDNLEIIIQRARGTGLPAAPLSLAMACVSEALAALGKAAERQGAMVRVRSAARTLGMALLPEAGARAPSARDVRWTSFAQEGDVWVLHALRGSLSASPDVEAVRARETARLLRHGDEILELEPARARTRYLEALERAPRHSEIIARIVGIDAAMPGRAEAALALLAELRGDRGARLGTAPGELLAATGDRAAAVASLERCAELEESPPLAARALELAARHAPYADEAARLLDLALARSPRSASARWARIRKRLELGRIEDALADAEQLEALAEGPESKHALWLRVGGEWRDAGLAGRAASIFERALLYAPDEPESLAGLGAALVGGGHVAQGVVLLRRALDLAEDLGGETSSMRLPLARALAESMDDLPAAVSQVCAIPHDAHEAVVARGLEGRWRATLGDLAGAALAFARLREVSAAFEGSRDDPRVVSAVGFLREAARMLRERSGDLPGAQRHLAAALRLRPHDEELRREYKAVCTHMAGRERGHERDAHRFSTSEAESETHRTALAPRPVPLDLALAQDEDGTSPVPPERGPNLEGEDDEARVEELTRQLQARPADEVVADELATRLERLRRGHELVALLFARLEDAVGDGRSRLEERARATLQRALSAAEKDGRAEDAALFRSALTTL